MASPMEQPTLTPAKCFVRDLTDGQEVNSIFVVRAHSRRQRRNGETFLKLRLGDVTGSMEAVVWDEVDRLAAVCPSGAIVRVLGVFCVDERYGGALTIKRMRAAVEGEYDLGRPDGGLAGPLQPAVLGSRVAGRDGSASPPARPARPPDRPRLPRGAGGQVLPPGLPARAARALPLGGRGRQRPGRQVPRASTATLPVAGALLHDIGKVEAYSSVNGAIELTDAGKLLGEIPLGYYMVRRAIEEIEGFPQAGRRCPAAHRVEPSRQARARQPGRAVHARGHARALRRQPGRQRSGASTASSARSRTVRAGRTSTAGSRPPHISASGRPSWAQRLAADLGLEGVDHRGVELVAGEVAQLGERRLRPAPLAVGPPLGHRAVRVADGHDAGGDRDAHAREAARVAAAVDRGMARRTPSAPDT